MQFKTPADSDFSNKRILLIDDNPAIHDDFRKILLKKGHNLGLSAAERDFFGEESQKPLLPEFELDSAFQGQEGFEQVKNSKQADRPYATVFVDMRMPPGWDGLRTIEEIWKVDPNLQIVICSAFSDHSWPDICNRLGQTDQLLILKKPFDNSEVSQLALAVTKKWNLAQQAKLNTAQLENLVNDQTHQLKEQDRALRQKQKLEAVGSLAGGIAHEFNNLLQMIHGLATISLDDVAESHPVRKNLDGIVGAADRAQAITKQLLSFSRQQPTQKMLFGVNEIVDASLQMLSPLLGKNIKVNHKTSHDSGKIMVSGEVITQAILNLCTNAADAMHQVGEITISAEKVRVQGGACSFQSELDLPSGEYSVISVTDNGVGIPRDRLERIFEPFYSTKDVGKGTGMGLAMVYGTMQEHGGTVTVDSVLGKGTTVRMYFPAQTDQVRDGNSVAINSSKLASV